MADFVIRNSSANLIHINTSHFKLAHMKVLIIILAAVFARFDIPTINGCPPSVDAPESCPEPNCAQTCGESKCTIKRKLSPNKECYLCPYVSCSGKVPKTPALQNPSQPSNSNSNPSKKPIDNNPPRNTVDNNPPRYNDDDREEKPSKDGSKGCKKLHCDKCEDKKCKPNEKCFAEVDYQKDGCPQCPKLNCKVISIWWY